MAAPFALKNYQTQALEALRRYLLKSVDLGPDDAFYSETKRPYVSAPSIAAPYVCLRVPTGGGKTILAAYAVGAAADAWLKTETPVVLWLTPSKAILDQTINQLRNRAHSYRRALAERFGENLRVLSLTEALQVGRADYDGGAVIVVSTIQALRVEEKEGRKVYEANGALMDHFTGLSEELLQTLERDPDTGLVTPSLANALRIRRPMAIIDEAHNARTPLSFETLERFSPSLLVEFTATPVTPKEADPLKGVYSSNVLHHVSAAELKAAEMIKLPIILRGRPNPKETIADALSWLDELADKAKLETQNTGEFIRPVMLLQAEPKYKDKPSLHADEVRRILLEDFRVDPAHVVVATGSEKGLDGIDLLDPASVVRFIITQQALKEGWDCSFAYVLCSVAEQKSSRAVEQLLGRILRMPSAKRKQDEALNRAYAFATTTSFQEAAKTLQDGLVNNGFEKIEAAALISAPKEAELLREVEESLPAGVDVAPFALAVQEATKGRVTIDAQAGVIRARGPLNDYDRKILELELPQALAPAITMLVNKSRGARLTPEPASMANIRFAIPLMAVLSPQGLLAFDKAHILDSPWPLEQEDAAAILNFFKKPSASKEEAHIDANSEGKITTKFIHDLQTQLNLAMAHRGWSKPALVNWIDRRLPLSERRDVTKISSTLFISHALDALAEQLGLSWEEIARARFQCVEAVARTMDQHRKTREAKAYQQALFTQDGLDIRVDTGLELVFEETKYAYRDPYKGGTLFKKHFFRVVGDLKASGEEFDCAVYLDNHPKVKTWARNTDRQAHSFWLQTASDKFYPDFVALLEDGRILVVEYKGEAYASNDDSKEKKLLGELWADRSGGSCLFLMVDDKKFQKIDLAIQGGGSGAPS